MAWLYVILAIIVIALIIVIANLKIVPQSKAYAVSYTHLDVYKRQALHQANPKRGIKNIRLLRR